MTTSLLPASRGLQRSGTRWLPLLAGTAALLAASAFVVKRQTRKAEREFPPRGDFVSVDGIKLHYLQYGNPTDTPLVLLHGNGVMAEDFDISGLVGKLMGRYRVIVFDRPGYGYSERPAGRDWTPKAQAELIAAALEKLGVNRPLVLGHSWGAMVALEMGLSRPQSVSGLLLLSGYYYPSMRVDVTWLSMPAVPLLGTLMRHTLSPLIGRLLWPLSMKRMFAPASATRSFKERYPVWMSLRPSQLHASAAEAAGMIPAAWRMRKHYDELRVPTLVVGGSKDRLLSTQWHARRLHEEVPGSRYQSIDGAGHMVHHVATDQVAAAIDRVADMALEPSAYRGQWRPADASAADTVDRGAH